jgi:hypothetical protein
MHDPIIDGLSALGADADRVVLADPADLRRAGTHRNRMRLAAVAVAVLAVVGGGTFTLRPSGQALPVPGGTPTVAASAEPCQTDLASCIPPEVSFLVERLPAPCAVTEHPSEAKLIHRSTGLLRYATFVEPVIRSSAGRTESTYRAGGAAAYLAEVRAMVARCPSVVRAGPGSDPVTLRYREVSTGGLGGEESVLLSRTYPTEAGEQAFLIGLVRRGETVLVIVDYGSRGSASPRDTFDRFLGPFPGAS